MIKASIKQAKNVALFCIDTLLTLSTRPILRPERVLIIRLDAIGDFVLWIDAARATADYYRARGKRVILLANAAWASWCRDLGLFDDVIPLDRSRFASDLRYRFQMGNHVRQLGCSIALQPAYSREALFGDALIRLSGAAQRIGSTGDTSNMAPNHKKISDRWYTQLIPASPSACMELFRNAEFVRGLGVTGFEVKIPDLRAISTLRPDERFLAEIAEDQGYYVLFPGASWDGKRWPSFSFAQIANQIYRQTGWRGVICGGPADIALAESLRCQSHAPLLNWAGRTDLAQLAAILSASQLLVTNDTSATHIAAACGVHTVCILGGGHFGRFLPYQIEHIDERPLPSVVAQQMPCFGCNWQCIYKRVDGLPAPCVDEITVSQVWREVEKILQSVLHKTNIPARGAPL